MMKSVSLLTSQEERVLRARAEGSGIGEVAKLLGISEQTIKNHLSAIYAKLDAANTVEALRALGWIVVPGEPVQAAGQCDFVGRCGRRDDHRGQHGGFRPIVDARMVS